MDDKEEVIHYCFGCGLPLQSEDPKGKGYIPGSAFKEDAPLLCQRCFKIQHYNQDDNKEDFNIEQFKLVLNKAKEDKSLIVYIIDLFSFESSFVDDICKLLKGCNILLVANKRDLLPKSVGDEKLQKYVVNRVKEHGLNVNNVIILSARKNYNMDLFMEKIMALRNNGNVYFVGSASCGKSSIINAILKNYSQEEKHFITTSSYPGTTMEVIEVPIDDSSFIYDTPGLSISNSMLALVERNVVNLITPKNEIKPRTFQMMPEHSLVIGGLAYMNFVKGAKTGFTVYCSNQVTINQVRYDKVENTFDAFLKNNNVKPISEKVTTNKNLIEHRIKINKPSKYDICIMGYCWISFEGNQQEIIVYAPNGISVKLTEAKI
ncbi:MAG: ribosome biogenesis GTPase YqeH [Bacilli bacterium]|nr:ribosome biogenesis GTPase YqeH [Bacilli bacterium]